MNDLPTIAHNLRTQDSRVTGLPIFVVQQKVRQYGLDPHWSNATVWMSLGEDGGEADPEMAKALEAGRREAGYYKTGYIDNWVFVQPFFTERGAQDYILINGHNLCEPRIYVESGWRNAEWELVREHLMGL